MTTMTPQALGQAQLTLSTEDAAAFMQAEEKIRRGLRTFIEVGEALLLIQEKQWFLVRGYQTWQEYCEKEWGISARSAIKMSKASQQVKALSEHLPAGIERPSNRTQVEALKGAGDDKAQAQAWTAAQEQSGKTQPTAEDVAKASRQLSGSVQMELPTDFPQLPLSFNGPIFTANAMIGHVPEAIMASFEIVPASPSDVNGYCQAVASCPFVAVLKKPLGQFATFAAAQQACGDWLVDLARTKGIIK